MTGRSRDSAYWLARLEREHSAIAQRLHAGEIASVRAAAIEAGLIREPSPLIELRRAWRKASPEDRTAFIAEVALSGVSGATQPGRDGRRRAEPPQPPGEEADLFAPSSKAAKSSRRIQLSPPKPAEPPEAPRVAEPRASLPVPTPPRPFPPALNPAPSHGNPDHPANGQMGNTTPGIGGTHGTLPPSPPANGESRPLSRVRRLFGLTSAREETGGGGSVEPSRHGVAIGQRYVKIDAGPGAWQVLSVFAGPLSVPHARIASVEEPDVVRVVSLAALTDRSRYQPLP